MNPTPHPFGYHTDEVSVPLKQLTAWLTLAIAQTPANQLAEKVETGTLGYAP